MTAEAAMAPSSAGWPKRPMTVASAKPRSGVDIWASVIGQGQANHRLVANDEAPWRLSAVAAVKPAPLNLPELGFDPSPSVRKLAAQGCVAVKLGRAETLSHQAFMPGKARNSSL